jgi:hypothetical protein
MHESRSTGAAAFPDFVSARVMPRTPSLELSVLPSGGGQKYPAQNDHDRSTDATFSKRIANP